MLRLVVAVLAVLAAAGCQSQKLSWTKEGSTQADFETDQFNCLKRMHESGFSGFTSIDDSGRGLSSSGPVTSRYVKNCLVARGWTPSLGNR